jgi:hypothetical protein
MPWFVFFFAKSMPWFVERPSSFDQVLVGLVSEMQLSGQGPSGVRVIDCVLHFSSN